VTSCHGGRSLPITLIAVPEAAADNYLRLLPRVRDGLRWFWQYGTGELAPRESQNDP
jgi:hypothetical protein